MTNWRPASARLNFALIVALMVALTAPAATSRGGKQSLRKLLKLPQLQSEFSLRFSATGGFVLTGEHLDTATEIDALQKQMQRTPADAPRYFRLAELHRIANDDTNATNALARSVELYRQLADTQSENAELLARFGRALTVAGHDDEAESILRRALKLGPKDWRCWSALGEFHHRDSTTALAGGISTDRSFSMERLLAAAAKKGIPADRVEQARKSIDEALDCAERAIALAPNEPQPYSDRALFLCSAGMLRYIKQVLQGEVADAVKFYQATISTNAQADLWRMADLTPDSPAAVTKAVMFELMAAAFQIGKSGLVQLADGELWNQLPDSRRQSIRRGLTRLENLGQGGNKTVAASALEFLGGLQWMLMRDRTGSESNLRRSLALDPARELAWNLLMGLLVDGERFPDALAAAESRLKVKETARNHVAAAKVCDKLNRFDKAQSHTDAAIRLDPNGYLANLSAAVVILKRGTTDNSIQQARRLLERAGNADGHPASQDEWVEWNLTRGIFYALGDDPAAARRELKRVLDADPDNETARQALAIVGN